MRHASGSEPSTVETGAHAERLGERFLEARGLRVVARNFRTRAGELDLVMLDGRQLVVVEIRYRARAAVVHPAVTVTVTKRRRLLCATSLFLQRSPQFRDHALRFDVLALSGPLDTVRCDWIRSAFTADDR